MPTYLVFHLVLCLQHFNKCDDWMPDIPACAHELLRDLMKKYSCDDSMEALALTTAPTTLLLSLFFTWSICTSITSTPQSTPMDNTKLDHYFSGIYPCCNGNVLSWWKVSVHYMLSNFIPKPYSSSCMPLVSQSFPRLPAIFYPSLA